MYKVLTYEEIDREAWRVLVRESKTGTWFQGPEAYEFFASMPDLFRPFAIAVERVNELTNERALRGVCVGYVTKEKSRLKQYFTRRAIILGGPVFSGSITEEEVYELMSAVRKQLQILDFRFKILNSPIYIETRNFNDYSRWKEAFERAGFTYKKHLNFHVDCTDEEAMWERLSENRRRQLRRSDADAVIIIENKNKENTADAEENIKKQEKKNAESAVANCDLRVTNNPLACEQAPKLEACESRTAGNDTPSLQDSYPEGTIISLQKCVVPPCENTPNEEDIREWYEILKELYRTKVKTPLWPEEFFLEAYRQGVGKFLLVKHNNHVIGGSMVVSDGRTVYEWFECGRNAEYKEQYPSVMATWAGMKLAHEMGCARYDMMGAGEPGVPYGVRDFKSEFGGAMVEHGRFLCVCKPLLYKIGVLAVKMLKGK